MPDDPGSTAKKVNVPESLESSLRANGARIASRYGNFVEMVQARTASPGQNTSNLEFLKPRLTQQVVKRASWSDALTKRATVLPQTINMLQLRIPYPIKPLGLVWSRTNRARGLQRATAGMRSTAIPLRSMLVRMTTSPFFSNPGFPSQTLS